MALTRIDYQPPKAFNDGSSWDFGSPKAKERTAPCELVKYEYGEHLYPSGIIGTQLITSSELLFSSELTAEQTKLQSDRVMDSFFSKFGGEAKHGKQLEIETQAITQALYTLYNTRNKQVLAKRICANPTKLATLQAQIESNGCQLWREVNSVLKVVGLVASVNLDGDVQIGFYSDTAITETSNGFTHSYHPITWTEPKPQANQILMLS